MNNSDEKLFLTHNGRNYHVDVTGDDMLAWPWDEYDGHGVIHERTDKDDKRAGEVLLGKLDGSRDYFFYDVRETQRTQIDMWLGDAVPPEGKTRKQWMAELIQKDIAYCREWINGQRTWFVISIECGGHSTSLGGVDLRYDQIGLQHPDFKVHVDDMVMQLESAVQALELVECNHIKERLAKRRAVRHRLLTDNTIDKMLCAIAWERVEQWETEIRNSINILRSQSGAI